VRSFFRNLGPILMLAVVALLASAALVGAALALVLGTPIAAALLFGALISATDPVAVVAVFRQLGVPERLLVLVEGESLLNDGVAIVLFTILLSAALGADVSVGAGIVEFLRVFFGGAAIGAVLGLGAASLLPWLDRNLAIALTLGVAYGSFVLADDVLGFSGVMAGVAGGHRHRGVRPEPRVGRRPGVPRARVGGAGLRRQRAAVPAHRPGDRAAAPRRQRRSDRPGHRGRARGPGRRPSCPSCRCSSGSRTSRGSAAATRRS
jgi:hypothetical protein